MTRIGKNICTVVDRTDPWVLASQEEPQFPLSVVEVAYQAIFNATTDSLSTLPVSKESDETYLFALVENSTYYYKCLDIVFSSNEAIMEAMIGPRKICEYIHHKSYFLPDLSMIKNYEFHVRLDEGIDKLVHPFPKEALFF